MSNVFDILNHIFIPDAFQSIPDRYKEDIPKLMDKDHGRVFI
ncbi:MAG: hypothetical protein QXY77_04640 [Thermoplasmatales archaeon]